jgi:hypothetical protein
MEKIMKDNIHLISFAILLNLYLLIASLAGYLTAWMLFWMAQELRKRPGINIKEF